MAAGGYRRGIARIVTGRHGSARFGPFLRQTARGSSRVRNPGRVRSVWNKEAE